MAARILTESDLRQIRERGISTEDVLKQIETFKREAPFCRLLRPCTTGDGIIRLDGSEIERLSRSYIKAQLQGRVLKFVPASGAASRMFKVLHSAYNRLDALDIKGMEACALKGDSDCADFIEFTDNIGSFAFYPRLKWLMRENGLDLEALIQKNQWKIILEYILSEKGLSYAGMPKGLIDFHLYRNQARTPIEEHIVEALEYATDKRGVSRLHFTVSPEHEALVADEIARSRSIYEKEGRKINAGLSFQDPSTDTVAVDLENRPFRDDQGRILFRPGGHGALLGNLNRLDGDIVFLKNIDNIVPDRLKQETCLYKKVLGGLLVELQQKSFEFLKRLERENIEREDIEKIFEFAREGLNIVPPEDLDDAGLKKRNEFLFSRLNRPIRVCGMVRNEGEPGGGPFWVENEAGSSIQIVESVQVDPGSDRQQKILRSATHFNPVDIVCGLRDYRGRAFDLAEYRDDHAVFISIKSKGGRELKALELPGLWNGSMAFWNTVFVEVPITTFNPVKTVNDLLRKKHQALI